MSVCAYEIFYGVFLLSIFHHSHLWQLLLLSHPSREQASWRRIKAGRGIFKLDPPGRSISDLWLRTVQLLCHASMRNVRWCPGNMPLTEGGVSTTRCVFEGAFIAQLPLKVNNKQPKNFRIFVFWIMIPLIFYLHLPNTKALHQIQR